MSALLPSSTLFKQHPHEALIRRLYDDATETWWFSVIDIIRAHSCSRKVKCSGTNFDQLNQEAMLIIFKRGMTRKQIDALWAKLRNGRKRKKKTVPDIHQFVGTIKLKEDPLVIQKRMRDDWR